MYALGNHLEAIDCYDKTLELISNHTDAYHNNRLALYALRKKLEAMEVKQEEVSIAIGEVGHLDDKKTTEYYTACW